MSKESTVVFKKSVSLECPAQRKSSIGTAAQLWETPNRAETEGVETLPLKASRAAKGSVPLADLPWSAYVSRGACDLLSSSLNVAFDAVDSHDLRAAMATAATLTRSNIVHSPVRESSPGRLRNGSDALPRIATAAGAAPPRMEMADFTLAYNLPEVPSWKLGYTPRFAAASSVVTTATRLQMPMRQRDLTERAMEVDLRLPSPPGSSISLLSPFTACANERAARMQTALDRNNFDSPTKWEAMAASGGSPEEDEPTDGKDEGTDWSYMLSLAMSRREQASQKLKEMEEQLQVQHASLRFARSRVLTLRCRIFRSSSYRVAPDHCAPQPMSF
jgi:hypothetical protein